MPVEANYSYNHRLAAQAQTGYELSPVTGLFSIVSPQAVVTNLNNLSTRIMAYLGGGMPPVENITTPLGVRGGSYVQSTVIRPRVITLDCLVEGKNLGQIQKIKSGVIAQIAPYNSLNSAKSLKLRYQLTNYCGDLIGTLMEVPVLYAGDLTGQTDNLYQDRFQLQFVEYNPPSIKELTPNTPSLGYNTTRTTTTGFRYRTSIGEWKFISSTGPIVTHYDANGELWMGNKSQITNRSGTVTQAITKVSFPLQCSLLAIAHDQNNNIYAGGNFTSPQLYLMKYNGSTWSAVGGTFNDLVRTMAFDNAGNLYVGGQFTTPTTAIGKWDGATWSSLGTGILFGGSVGTVTSIVKGLDGYMYVAGAMTSANGVAVNNIARWTGTTFAPLGSGTNGTINSLAVLPDGRIVAAGTFSSAGGIACSNIAIWNGTQWQPLGAGLNGQIYNLTVNQLNGDIYATGVFTGSGSVVLTSRMARWNGSNWVQVDANNSADDAAQKMDLRASDGEFAVPSGITAATFSNGPLNTINYTGTADVFPQIKFTGPGVLNVITNYTTGKALYFNNYTMLAGETATYTFDPATGVTFESSFFGKTVIGRVMGGSDKTQFSLVAGQPNYIVPYITGASGATKVELIYQNTHWSLEAGAA